MEIMDILSVDLDIIKGIDDMLEHQGMKKCIDDLFVIIRNIFNSIRNYGSHSVTS